MACNKSLSTSNCYHQQGAALIFAILIAFLMGTFAMFYTYHAQQSLTFAQNVSDQLLARYKSEDALNQSIYALSSLNYQRVDWPDDNVSLEGAFWGGEQKINDSLSVAFQDLGGLLSVVPFLRHEWLSVLALYNVPEQLANAIVDQIEDWTDPDNLKRIQGMEIRHYEQSGLAIRPRNRIPMSMDELKLIPAVSPQIYKEIQREAIYWGPTNRSPLSGSDAMIAAYGGRDMIESVRQVREQNLSADLLYNSMRGVDSSQVNRLTSGMFRVMVSVQFNNAMFSHAVDVNLQGNNIMPFYITGWK